MQGEDHVSTGKLYSRVGDDAHHNGLSGLLGQHHEADLKSAVSIILQGLAKAKQRFLAIIDQGTVGALAALERTTYV